MRPQAQGLWMNIRQPYGVWFFGNDLTGWLCVCTLDWDYSTLWAENWQPKLCSQRGDSSLIGPLEEYGWKIFIRQRAKLQVPLCLQMTWLSSAKTKLTTDTIITCKKVQFVNIWKMHKVNNENHNEKFHSIY